MNENSELKLNEIMVDNNAELSLEDRITEKRNLLKLLQIAMEDELKAEINYLNKCNKVKLSPDHVKETLKLSRNPTEKQVQAFYENLYNAEFTAYKIAKANISLINKQIDLLNDYISLERYVIRKELK